ncbi:hypothetical protein Ccrd_024929 [Cynara cardunculus var. scolymus]|uniref:Uncharacterized protein n=1 Tax=Cynara cardunculus var. scolymus TaxID=59895 RepID=A0A103XBR5_CYNCS|nr:hypothetical protein Ccrd_024929 [Cynara cardunculus var. scolymus]
MGRFSRSGRSRSYSPRRSLTPPPSSRRRYDDPRDRRYDDFRDRRSNPQRRRSPAPSGLLVRNISLDSSGRHGGGSGRRSPPRFSRRRSYSRSVSPARREFSDRDHKPRDHFLPSRSRSISRSRSPHDARTLKSRHYSRSPGRNGRGLMDPRDGNPRFQESKRSPHDKRATGDWKSAVANEGPSSRSLSPSPPYQSGTHTRS